MIEVLLVALLVWLWIVERRLNSLNDTVRSLKLDLDGLRHAPSAGSVKQEPREAVPELPEAAPIAGADVGGAPAH